MNHSAFIESKKIEKGRQKQIQALTTIYKQDKLGKKFKAQPLNKKEARIALILLNADPEQKQEEIPDWHSESYWYWRMSFQEDDPRLASLKKLSNELHFLREYEPILHYFFPKDWVPLIHKAWDRFPQLMYQRGYNRRSFRAPFIPNINFIRQLNWLSSILQLVLQYDMTLKEFLRYSNHIDTDDLAIIWATAIEEELGDFKPELLDIVYNRHYDIKVSRSIIKTMLLSRDEACHLAIENLLLAAKRQEGLRQMILETLDETSLLAQKRMMKLIIDEKLARFSSVVRAIDVWMGIGWTESREPAIRRTLQMAYDFLTHPEKIPAAIKRNDHLEIYTALWAQGTLDVEKTEPLLDELTQRKEYAKVLLALSFIAAIGLPSYNWKYAINNLKHPSIWVTIKALGLITKLGLKNNKQQYNPESLFESFEEILKRLPEKSQSKAGLVFPWTYFEISRKEVYEKMELLASLFPEKLDKKIDPYLEDMPICIREKLTRKVLPNYWFHHHYEEEELNTKPLTLAQQSFALRVVKDRSPNVYLHALKALHYAKLNTPELEQLKDLFRRKSSEIRTELIQLFLAQKDQHLLPLTSSLLKDGKSGFRLAGLDLLIQLKKKGRLDKEWLNLQLSLFKKHKRISIAEKKLLTSFEHSEEQVLYTMNNGFGFFQNLPPTPMPSLPAVENSIFKDLFQQNKKLLSQPEKKIIQHLEILKDLVLSHRNHEYEVTYRNGSTEQILLGNQFQNLKPLEEDADIEQFKRNYPLYTLWHDWWRATGLNRFDLWLIGRLDDRNYQGYRDQGDEIVKLLNKYIPQIKFPQINTYHWNDPVENIVKYLAAYYLPEPRYLIDYYSFLCSRLTKKLLERMPDHKTNYYYSAPLHWRRNPAINFVRTAVLKIMEDCNDQLFYKAWTIEWWAYCQLKKISNTPSEELPPLALMARAYELGLIQQDEMIQKILTEDGLRSLSPAPARWNHIYQQQQAKLKKQYPWLLELFESLKNRLLDIELNRGDSATEASSLVYCLNHLSSSNRLAELLQGLGKEKLIRGYIYQRGDTDLSKKEQFSQLLKNCHPREKETAEDFKKSFAGKGISEGRLLEVAAYSPQWLPFIAQYLGWKGLESAVWWLHAHTKTYHDVQTETEVAKYSSIPINDFKDGAVDIDWFREIYAHLGKTKWTMLYNCAKYISEGNGHSRAQLYADVLLGKTKINAVSKRIKEKRNQDYVRVYGLIPLSRRVPEKDLLKRYQLLMQFLKESRQFGAQRQASEKRAVSIAMDNLARTAGYRDSTRLVWTMELKLTQNIMKNNKPIGFGDIQVVLKIDQDGIAQILAKKEGQILKSIPEKIRKQKEFTHLRAQQKVLKNQYSRAKKSLEQAMVMRDPLEKDEILQLLQHPIIGPVLKKIVFIGDGHLGWLTADGLLQTKLQSQALPKKLRIAHPIDLKKSGEWSTYMHYCFDHQIKQPFKQIYRELYLATSDEIKHQTKSLRYAGHQVQAKKAVALLRGRGWTVDYETGLQKVLHQDQVIAKVYALADWFTPAEVESPTLEEVSFLDRKTLQKKKFNTIDPIIFSEVMRDLDLVVSIAHVGEVDPEASLSTIEVRRIILEETCRLFKLDNVSIQNNFAIIQGNLGEYSIHLGSTICHQIGKGALFIVPIHSQHRGRIFLPFMDEDPKTAELIAKVLLLSKDQNLQDPTILAQIG